MRTPDRQLLALIIATTVLLAQGISTQGAFAVAKWGDQGAKAPRIADATVSRFAVGTVSNDSNSPVWEELSRMSSGFKGRNLIAGSQTEGDAATSIADGEGVSEANKAGLSSASDAVAKTEVTSSLKGLTPTECYMKCREALIKAKSIAEVIPYLSQASGAEASSDLAKNPDDAKSKLELLQLMMPPQVKVTSEKITGSTAVLTAIPIGTSSMDEGMSQLMNGMAQGLANAMGSKEKLPPTRTETAGSIYMTLEDGVWKQDKEKWSSHIKDASGSK